MFNNPLVDPPSVQSLGTRQFGSVKSPTAIVSPNTSTTMATRPTTVPFES